MDLDATTLFEEIGRDRELFHSLVETAQHDLPEYLQKMKAAAGHQDYAGVRQSAHAMKTTLAHWKAVKAMELALAIEIHCREGRIPEALALLPALQKAVASVVQSLNLVEAQL